MEAAHAQPCQNIQRCWIGTAIVHDDHTLPLGTFEAQASQGFQEKNPVIETRDHHVNQPNGGRWWITDTFVGQRAHAFVGMPNS
jgi:hypothetical protein